MVYVDPTPSENQVQQAFSPRHTVLAPGPTYSPSDILATIEFSFGAGRPVVSAQDQIGLHAGDELTPFWLMEPRKGVLNQGAPIFCATTGPAGTDPRISRMPQTPGICLSEINANDVARTASAARFEIHRH